MSTPDKQPGTIDTSSMPLQIEMEQQGSTIVLQVSGMAAAEIANQLSRALQEAAAQGPKLLAVDLSGLSFISSTGLGSLVAVHVTCRKNNIKLILVNPKPYLQDILQLTKLNTLFTICDSLEEAMQLEGTE